MRKSSLLVLAAALIPSTVLAFKDTSPLLIWSSEPNSALRDAASEITSGLIAAEEVYNTMSSLGCDWETLVVMHVDELHQSHLASLSLPSPSPADLHIPYLLRPDRQTFDSAVNDWAQICGAEVVSGLDNLKSGKNVVKVDVARSDETFSTISPNLATPHLILLTGSTPLAKRQLPRPRQTNIGPSQSISASAGLNSTVPTGGPLLDRVQLLTTPIITALLITFLLFVPIIAFGVSALVGIQVPPRMMEINKGLVVGKDRKEQ